MLLDPNQKKSHIQRHWGDELLQQALKHAETIYAARYKKLYPDGIVMTRIKRTASATSAAGRVKRLIDCELSDDEDNLSETGISDDVDPVKPWLHDFHGYLDSVDDLGHCSIVQWWGLNAGRYPVWASLARDYLAVMASSVSSERAFSSAGITISKRRNRLKADIVEALQFLKCAIRRDLLFCESPSLLTE
ncbi:hATC-domain-containing protein, partial [Wolfiporia cocos MD-104 SS10]